MWISLRAHIGLLSLLLLWAPHPGFAMQPDPQARFKELIQQAHTARAGGDYAEAIKLLEAAYEISPRPVLLNNIGKACEELGWYDKAVDAYKRVANDPKADPGIRTLDEARIGKLSPLLKQAWVVLPESAVKGGAWVNGAPYQPSERGDFGIPPGPASVETMAADGETLLLLPIDAPAGRRTAVETSKAPPNLGQVTVPSGSARPIQIIIDGYQLRGYGPEVTRIALKSGSHRFLLAGAEKGTSARVVAELAPGAMDATLLVEAEYTGGKSKVKVGPIATLVVGLGAAGFGGWQLSEVSADRDALAASTRDQLNGGRIRARVQSGLDEENEELATRHAVGVAAIAGGLAVVGAGVWWWLSGDDETQHAANGQGAFWLAPSAQGLFVGGTF